ncbi:MAG: DUF1905 domain-containing protein [Alphaproteobacteria bacterium]|nr:DUF1905 domain-containing protein [Alphaproteobacteria bacterium]MBU1513856.1 DUF1905 domain-containing protein [Alphaproteobacteria bacterium]MBU2094499.1 DUF1905 domain-containing protein [Alphaproteobacteria bacterium]MBU2151240.1 DUF1905 domain-containing protein [Alphaproteobacteria bacterium]MBU2305890.1 DUF1905 domain-containing protein [Alphaproteobacteria bacterium]
MSDDAEPLAAFSFDAEVIHWRGPSPYFFAALPAEVAAEVQRLARAVSYGWGMIPVAARIGEVAFTTSLFPKPEGYLMPLKDAVRRAAAVTAGDRIAVEMTVRLGRA